MEPLDVLYEVVRHYINDLVQDVDPALITKIDGFRRSRNLAGLTSCSCHFDSALHTVNDWKFLRQIEAFFKKNANLANKEVCRQNALDSFVQSEEQCHQTNLRLRDLIGYDYLVDKPFQAQIRKMVRYIDNVLGDFQLFLDDLPNLVKVTPGATATSRRKDSLPHLKMKMHIHATRRSVPYLNRIYNFYGFKSPKVKCIHSNRVELVPKNWKTDRTVACEPEGNVPLQLAFDTYAKRRLRRFGINLRDQSANMSRAKHASIHNDDVTVDFKNASDTICYNAVSLVFPIDWFNYLDSVRTPCYRGVFGDGTYAKFSSMGNGSTFTIETLIFAAACYAVGARNFLVYGDDVIIGKEFFPAFSALTRFLGFTINEDKTFSSGPFRESCGGDFFNGVDVTPTYVRSLDMRKASLCHLVNTLVSLTPIGGNLWRFLSSLVKEEKLPLVPYNEGTMSGIWIEPNIARRLGLLKRRNHIDYCKSYVAKATKVYFVDSRGYYLWFLSKNRQVRYDGPWELSMLCDPPTQTSSVPVFDHVYVRKRVSWTLPANGTPDHLYWWSELISPLK